MTRKETDTVRAMIRERIRGRYSYSPESLPHAAENARRELRLRRRWEALESAGLVRMRFVPDDCSSFDDLAGDTYDVEYNRDTVPGGERTIVAQRKAFEREIERDGVWGCVTEYRLSPCPDCHDAEYGLGVVHCGESDTDRHCGGWAHGDSCWGFVGTDAHGYESDLMSGAIDALRDALVSRCPTCRAPRGGVR